MRGSTASGDFAVVGSLGYTASGAVAAKSAPSDLPQRLTGAVMPIGDDFYLPGCLQIVASSFSQPSSPDVVSGHAYVAYATGTLGVQFRHRACVLIQPATCFQKSAFEKLALAKPLRAIRQRLDVRTTLERWLL